MIMSLLSGLLVRYYLGLVDRSVYSRIHIYAGMPGTNIETVFATLRGAYHHALQGCDDVQLFDAEALGLGEDLAFTLRFFVNVVRNIPNKHVVVFTHQWKLAALALNYAVDVRMFSLFTDDPSGIACARSHLGGTTQLGRPPREQDYSIMVADDKMKTFAHKLSMNISSSVHYIAGPVTYGNAVRVMYEDASDLICTLLAQSGCNVTKAGYKPLEQLLFSEPLKGFDEDALYSIPGRDV